MPQAVISESLPPGPKLSPLAALIYWPGRNPLEFFTNLARTYGDVASYRMGGETVFFINHPQTIKDVLVTHQANFQKGRGLERAKRLLGDGLLTSEGDLHRRQRRLMQPAFHSERIAQYGRTMVEYADRLRSSWTDGAAIDVSRHMMRLTLSIAGKTLFDLDVESQAAEIGAAVTDVIESFWLRMLPFIDVIERLPVPRLRRATAARVRLDSLIDRLIAERRAAGLDRGDLLSMMLLAQDEHANGQGMSDRQVKDETMTILLAGHETTANALAWTWHLLSGAPDVERRMHEEIDRVLDGRLPAISDIASLPLVERIVTEAMRLFPPAWIIGRRAIGEYAVNGYVAPPRSLFLMSQWVMHRDPRFYSNPEQFDPDRWSPAFRASLPRFAYFPFGGGPRQCIGESFAWMELVLVVAAIAQDWSLQSVAGHSVIPQPLVTLRAKHGIMMTPHRRY